MILVLASVAAPAAANGLMSGYVCGPLPAAYKLDVQVSDDSEQMLRIGDAAVSALAKKQPEAPGSAALVLLIDMHAVREGVRRKGRDLGSVTDDSSDRIKARMNLWSNERDSILGGRKDRILDGPIDEIRIDIAINDKSNGKCVWRGEAIHNTTGEDQWRIAEKLTLRLIGLIGKDIRDREFTAE
ncbi:unnamed protein product [Laminaria digitata]